MRIGPPCLAEEEDSQTKKIIVFWKIFTAPSSQRSWQFFTSVNGFSFFKTWLSLKKV